MSDGNFLKGLKQGHAILWFSCYTENGQNRRSVEVEKKTEMLKYAWEQGTRYWIRGNITFLYLHESEARHHYTWDADSLETKSQQ